MPIVFIETDYFSMFNYINVNKLLLQVKAQTGVADLHGFLCGQVCICHSPEEELWQEFLDVQSNNDDLVHACYQELKLLVTEIKETIQSADMEFQLLLPDYETVLADRAEALAEWCHGFMNGLGLGIEQGDLAMSEDSREVLDDFSKICRMGLGAETDEEDEEALMQLIEYVWAGTLLIYEELYPNTSQDRQADVLH